MIITKHIVEAPSIDKVETYRFIGKDGKPKSGWMTLEAFMACFEKEKGESDD